MTVEEINGARNFRSAGVIRSGPGPLRVSRFDNRSNTPSGEKVIELSCRWIGAGRINGRPLSMVKTEANASAKDSLMATLSFTEHPSMSLMVFEEPLLLAMKRNRGLESPCSSLLQRWLFM